MVNNYGGKLKMFTEVDFRYSDKARPYNGCMSLPNFFVATEKSVGVNPNLN